MKIKENNGELQKMQKRKQGKKKEKNTCGLA